MNNTMPLGKFEPNDSKHYEGNKTNAFTEKNKIIDNFDDDNLDAILEELEKEELSNRLVEISDRFEKKYQTNKILTGKDNPNADQNKECNIKNKYQGNLVQQQTSKGNKISNKFKDQSNFTQYSTKHELGTMIDYNNKNNPKINGNQNNLPVSYARDKSYDFSAKNRKSLNKSLNTKFSKNIKGQETIYFQLVSKKEVGIESNFYMNPKLIQIIKDFHGYYDRNLKIWFVSFFNYLKIHEILTKIVEKEQINLSLIDNLPLEFLSKIDLKILIFKPEGEKKQFTLDYSNEPVKSIYDIPPFMYTSLYNFQRGGIEFGINKSCRFLLADEMGVGKTIQAIGCTSVFQDDWPVLIICPSSLKYNWRDEILNWLKEIVKSRDMVQVIMTSSDNFKSGAKFFIISYDLCLRMEKKLQDMDFNFIIADEAHYLKSREAKRTKVLLPLMQKSKRLILLSGTPIVARPSECFNLLRALRPDIFNKFLVFADRYCDPKNGPFGRDYTGSSNVKELNFILNSLMIRRLKKDVLSELPPKKRQKIIINTDDKVIKQIKILLNKSNVVIPEEVEGANFDSINSTFSKAYTLTGQAKIEGIQEYLNYLIENDCKFLIFAHHKVVLDGIEEYVIKKKINYMRIDGSIVNEKRHECVNKFQNNDDCKIAILAITACATGLTLTKASTVVFAEIYFTPAVMIQAEDRAHRIGQEHNSVNVHYLIGKDTVDEIIFPKLEDKFTVVSNALDAKKLNMEVQNVQKGEKGEIEVGKASKNLNATQINNLDNKSTNKIIEDMNKTNNEKSANKFKITDFFSKKSSSVSATDSSLSNQNRAKNCVNNKTKNLINATNSNNNINNSSKNDSSKAFENINHFSKIEEDPLDAVLEGFLNDEAFIHQIFENETYEGKVEDHLNPAARNEDHFDENSLAYFNLHKQGEGKRTREQMNQINNSILRSKLKSLGNEDESENLTIEKRTKRK